ncbi:sulfurtransferase complex subunit TusC [Nitrincola tapanii]|uniref:Sulfurtransferase complex subunit TusC n=1 Tax=Nitrincola tapanii TaxID=1708751 RepID=A0A5A9W414_9GAMM|nr:sulfurtransferase complex subunit TusC [Nitrincola tapanii]KAA0875447.1 sulfurtransferase complex subunit TusC [Nitrincola tapanii]
MAKSCLLISSAAPYGSSAARDLLDIALTASVFELPVALLLIGDGVLQLKSQQQPQTIAQKNLNAIQASLPLYDLERIYVEAEAMSFYDLQLEDLCLTAQPLQSEEIQALIAEFESVITL